MNNISYRVFFYDGENDFLNSTNKLTEIDLTKYNFEKVFDG